MLSKDWGTSRRDPNQLPHIPLVAGLATAIVLIGLVSRTWNAIRRRPVSGRRQRRLSSQLVSEERLDRGHSRGSALWTRAQVLGLAAPEPGGPSGPVVTGELYAPELAPAARRWITSFRASFPDVHMGDRGADRRGRQGRRPVTCSATHLGAWLGHAATGRRFERVDEVAIFQLRDGRIVHVWSLEDNLGRLQQRGLF
jgi:SnoaL-like polyketide cyclase